MMIVVKCNVKVSENKVPHNVYMDISSLSSPEYHALFWNEYQQPILLHLNMPI